MFRDRAPLVILVWLVIINYSCNNHQKVETSFYHWEHALDLDSCENELLQSLEVKHLYIRIFDVDFNDKSKPPRFLSPLKVKNKSFLHQKLIPCIYITNRSFVGISKKQAEQLALQTARFVKKIIEVNQLDFSDEIQIDCDWTLSTRVNYFHYLQKIKEHLVQYNQISATIRLHQYKYPMKTGVPPVDKGSLMAYNMGDFEDVNEKNAIYNNDILKQYLSIKNKYPIHLDVAMPVFSWALIFRFGKAMKIVNQPNLYELESNTDRFEKIKKDKFKVNENGYWGGLFLYEGDIIRVDKVDVEEIKKGLEMISAHGMISPDRIIYYQLYDHINQDYSNEDFKEFSAVFN